MTGMKVFVVALVALLSTSDAAGAPRLHSNSIQLERFPFCSRTRALRTKLQPHMHAPVLRCVSARRSSSVCFANAPANGVPHSDADEAGPADCWCGMLCLHSAQRPSSQHPFELRLERRTFPLARAFKVVVFSIVALFRAWSAAARRSAVISITPSNVTRAPLSAPSLE